MSGIFDQVINYAPPSLLKGTVTYKGTWSAATNTPTLINPPDSTTNGFYYVVSAAGTQFSLSFNIGDWIISNGSAWEKVDNTDAVSSVFGRTGAVVGVSTDYSSVGITATAVGASSPSTGAFTTLSATTPLAVASGGTGVASSTGTTNVVLSGSPTITTPVIAQINDANGNETLKLASIASAVNEVTIENAATGNAVHISATGGDASVGLHLAGKGASGYVNVQDSTDATKRIMFNASGGTTNTRTMLSSTQTVDRTLSLPDATDTLVGVAATQTLTNKTLTSPTLTAPVLGTPASGTVTNLTGTASININGTVGATTPSTVAGTTGRFTSDLQSAVNSSGGQLIAYRNAQATYGFSGGVNLDGMNTSSAQYTLGKVLGYTIDNTAGAEKGEVHIQARNAGALATVATITSTGLNSTAIGATTPSTGAFTTLSATGALSTTIGGDIITLGASGVGYLQTFSRNDANYIRASSAGGYIVFQTGGANNRAVINDTGLAVTGALDASGTFTLTSGTNANATWVKTGTGASSYSIFNNGNGLGVYYDTGSANLATFSSTGLAVTGTLSTQPSGTTNPVGFGATNTYGVLSFNNAFTTNTTIGIQGGGGVDKTMYYVVPTGGGHSHYVNGSLISAITSTGLAVTGTLSTTGLLGIVVDTSASGGIVANYTDTANTSGVYFASYKKSSGGIIGSVNRVSTTDAVVYNTTSDARLKENLRDFTDSGRLIDALKPRVFDWKDSDSNGKDVIGFVAQEEHAADPIFAHIGAVSVGDDDPTTITKQWQRSDAALIPILVAELQSLRKRLAALESK